MPAPHFFVRSEHPLGSLILSQGRCENLLPGSTGCARGNDWHGELTVPVDYAQGRQFAVSCQGFGRSGALRWDRSADTAAEAA